jgi:putative peptidoglycan lipid II flippase
MPTAARSTKLSAASLAPDTSSPRNIARSAASASAATMTSRILGVVREAVLASFFGDKQEMDAYRVAFRIPNLLRDLFAEGAMSASFVPTFTKRLTTNGKDAALTLGNNLTNALLLITGVLVVLGIIFAEPIVRLLVKPEYAANATKLELTVMLTRIMMPFLTFIALAAAAMGMLNALRHFFIPALSPAMFNVVSITGAIGLIPVMVSLGYQPITAAAVGTVVGGLAQWAVQWPLLRREGFRYRPSIDRHDADLARVLLLMGPGTLGLAATQVNVAVNTYLASGQTGAISWLDYAFRLMYLPIGLFGVSVATATTPVIARHVVDKDEAAVKRTIADSVSLMMMLNVPAMVGLIVLATPIVRVMYERGQFTSASTAATAAALQFYSIGLVGYSVVRILSPAFYALGSARTPVKVSAATVFVNASLNIVLFRVMGYKGLALGTAVAALFNASTLMFLLQRRLHGLEGRRIARSLALISIAALFMGVAAYEMNLYLPRVVTGERLVSNAARLILTVTMSLAVLAGAAHLLGIDEFNRARNMVMRRLRRSRP